MKRNGRDGRSQRLDGRASIGAEPSGAGRFLQSGGQRRKEASESVVEKGDDVAHDEAGRVLVALDRHRLRAGRELRSASQTALAGAAGVSAAAISQFENGHARPSAATLDAIADALRLPIGYFAARPGAVLAPPAPFFRSLRSTTVGQRRYAEALVGLVHELAAALADYVDLPYPRLPRMAFARSERDIDEAAAQTRRQMGLDATSPIPDVVQVLERHGAVTARFRVDARQMDAFSVAYPDRPVVVLGSDKGYRDRSRFDAAHELAHLVLHGPDDAGKKEAEAQAHRFAAAFLMPAEGIEHVLPRKADWPKLIALKQEWQVSLAALLMRAKMLRVMDDRTYTQAMKTMSARKWRNPEPGDLGPPEKPRLLAAALRAAADNGTTLEDLADRHGLPIEDLNSILKPSLNPRPRVAV